MEITTARGAVPAWLPGREGLADAAGSANGLVFVLTRFLYANRKPLRPKTL
jgi:hypothetical protein